MALAKKCDLKDCVLNKHGECMKTNKRLCPYYSRVLNQTVTVVWDMKDLYVEKEKKNG